MRFLKLCFWSCLFALGALLAGAIIIRPRASQEQAAVAVLLQVDREWQTRDLNQPSNWPAATKLLGVNGISHSCENHDTQEHRRIHGGVPA